MLAACCGPASALPEPGSDITFQPQAPTASPKAAVALQLDDGIAEGEFGDSGGGQFLWFNRFTPAPGDFPLRVESVQVAYGTSGVVLGGAVEIMVFQDADGDPLTGAELVASQSGTVQATGGAFVAYPLSAPPILEGPGDVLIAVVNRYATAGALNYPSLLDQSSSAARSWYCSWGADVPATPDIGVDTCGLMDSFNFPGNWLVRADVETNIPDTLPPVLLVNSGAVDEGATLVLTAAMLQASDPDTNDDLLLYVLTGGPGSGQLERTSGPGVAITSFTQAELNAGQVVYVHDDSETTSDGFNFDIQDGSGNDLTGQDFAITVNPLDDLAPVLVANTGISLAEGGTAAIDGSALMASDGDTALALLTYVVTSAPASGQLELASAPGTALGSFTQAQLDAGEVLYLHDDSETTADSFTFTVQDGSGNDLTGQVFAITVTAVDDLLPVLAVNAGLGVAEGGSASIGTAVLQTTDGDTAAAQLVYSVTAAPTAGQLERAGVAGVAIASFTQAEVDAGQVLYLHDGSNTASDAFGFDVQDAGGNAITGQTFSIAVSAVADDAVVASPTTLTLVEGSSGSFTVVLSTQPTGLVVIDLAPADPAIASVATAQVTFTPATWSTPQTVAVQAVDDSIAGGSRATGIQLAIGAATEDSTYAALPQSSVMVTTLDNDAAGIVVTPSAGLTTTEEGGSDTFALVLTSQPTADVVITLASSDATEGTVSPALLTFTAANWNVPQTVTVAGVNDGTQDEDQSWSVLMESASGDPDYDGMAIPAAGVVNGDDDAGLPVTPTIVPTASPWVLGALALALLVLGGAAVRGQSGRMRG